MQVYAAKRIKSRAMWAARARREEAFDGVGVERNEEVAMRGMKEEVKFLVRDKDLEKVCI
jgi:hypothetical protein